jgi:hypothetical protein
MENWPDIVRDSKLDVRFDKGHTIHISYTTDPKSGQRAVPRYEAWCQKRRIGRGAFADVWLEECTRGVSEDGIGRLRAVKQISTKQHGVKLEIFLRELEAISKFSHTKVSEVELFGR